jgi:hypothetical protein
VDRLARRRYKSRVGSPCRIAKEDAMRYLLPCLTALAVSAPPLRAGEREDALALVAAAVKAHGGEAALRKAQTGQRVGAGFLAQADRQVPFTDETTFSLPGRVRMVLDVNRAQRMLIVVTPDKAWQQTGGAPADLDRDSADELREELYIRYLTTLLPLRQDDMTLGLVPDAQVNGRPAAGIKVTSKGHRDARLYFDKQSGLLVKIERRARQAGVLLDKEYVFSDHKEFDGAVLPTREGESLNGKKFTDLAVSSWKMLPKVDDSLFSKP